ncbi:hypothetical protein CLOSTASPAR_06441 [[Clostridium] asparagiforme DSM 15981]|uniref:Uncharacterized protein n=1 Tax=[Clostridium] asparagiforme DSM 15981 TaxID=518636 RepID=C0DAY6_9FIRM|nr:hypothetical protein CLOSTASPAR_06441 [[Clostridium] asparagiforme DSM 15981]
MSFWGSLPFYHKPVAFSSPILNFGACREKLRRPRAATALAEEQLHSITITLRITAGLL